MDTRKTFGLFFGAALVVALAGTAFAQPGSKRYSGEIMDSACAKMGSHQGMKAAEGAQSAKDCTEKCVANGSKYVLYDSATKRTFQLDDQEKAKDFSGQKVKVTGTYDSSAKSIHVTGINAAP